MARRLQSYTLNKTTSTSSRTAIFPSLQGTSSFVSTRSLCYFTLRSYVRLWIARQHNRNILCYPDWMEAIMLDCSCRIHPTTSATSYVDSSLELR